MKRLLGLAGLGALIAVLGIFAAVALATQPPEHKVTICHAKPADTAANGWNAIEVDVASVGYQQSGHQDKHAADIIPAWSYTDGENTVSFGGLNLGTDFGGSTGAVILANGCVNPTPPPPPEEETGKLIVVKVVVNDDGGAKVASDFSFTVDGQPYAFESDGSNMLVLPEGDHSVGEVAAGGYTSSISDTSVKIKTGKTVLVRIKNDDIKGEEPPTDVCRNIEGNQAEIPSGMVKDEQGNCVTPPGPPHEVKGDASVSCILPDGHYGVSGSVDGQAADKVDPATIPGHTNGSTEVIVTRGDTSVKVTVSTNGDCGTAPTPPVVTPPAAVVTPPVQTAPTTPTTTTEPTAPLTPPTTTTKRPTTKKPAVEKPAGKTAPAAPKKAVAGAFAKEPPKLAYTP